MEQFDAYLIQGTPEAVTAGFRTLRPDQLDPGDVTVRVQYASVNYKDALAATGRGRIVRRFPCVGGIDAVGIVARSDTPRFKAGDEVIVHSHGFGMSHHGGYAPLARVPADWVNAVPRGLSGLDAITLGVAGYTAALAIDLMELNGCAPSRGKVLVNGATGGVASIVIDQLAQLGYEVTAVTRKPAETGYLRALGATDVIAADELHAGSRPLESVQWAAAVDSLGGEPLAGILRTAGKDGVVAAIGNAAGIPLMTTVMPFILRGVRLIGVNSDNEPAVRERIWHRLATDLRPRALNEIQRVVGFDELPNVIDDVISGRNRGRNVVRIGADARRRLTPPDRA